MDLRDAPEGAIPQFIIDSVANNLAVEFRQEAASRRAAVARGAETPELAATLLEKFGYGLAKAAHIAGIPSELMREVDQVLREIDPSFEAHRKARWASLPAAITYTAQSSG